MGWNGDMFYTNGDGIDGRYGSDINEWIIAVLNILNMIYTDQTLWSHLFVYLV